MKRNVYATREDVSSLASCLSDLCTKKDLNTEVAELHCVLRVKS
jgi:hypothetical protein